MPAIVNASAKLVNDKLGFSASAGDNPPIGLDYVPPLGDGKGYMPLELLLVSLSGCAGSTVASLLRRMHKTVGALSVNAEGERRDEHPTVFTKIRLRFNIVSPDASDADVARAVQLTEEKFCPVWAMLKNGVEVTTEVQLAKA